MAFIGDVRQLCTACSEYTKADGKCDDEFVCFTCGHTLNKCASLPGGLDALGNECNSCLSRRRIEEIRDLARVVRLFGKS